MPLQGLVHSQTRNETVHNLDDNVLAGGVLVLDELVEEQVFVSHVPTATTLLKSASTEKEKLALITSDLRDFIAFELSLVPEVECVFTAFRENQVFYVWIIIDQFEASVRERIYERQQDIIDEFPTDKFQAIDFDFYIIARLGRPVEELVGDNTMHKTYTR